MQRTQATANHHPLMVKKKGGSKSDVKDVVEVVESSGHTQPPVHSVETICIHENGHSSDQKTAHDLNFTCLEEYNNSTEYAEHVFPHTQEIGVCVDNSNQNLYVENALSGPPEGSVSSFMEESQRSSNLLQMPEHCQISDSNHGNEELCPVSSRGFNIHASLDKNDSSTDKQIGLEFTEIDFSCNNHAGSAMFDVFSLSDPVAASSFIGTEPNANSTICNTGTQNSETNNTVDSTLQSNHPVCSSDMLCIPCSDGLDPNPSSFIYSGNGKVVFPNNFDGGNALVQAQDSEFTTCMQAELFDLLDSMVPSSDNCNVDLHLQTSKTPKKEIQISKDTKTIEHCAYQENSSGGLDHLNSESLCYEPPRFPSVDFPFVTCDLISSADLQQAYSPLGIRQLTMPSYNHSLWDTSSKEGSPDIFLRNAAKSFLHTPSILKKRQRELLSPLREKCDKKSEKSLNQDLLCTSLSNRNVSSSNKDITCIEGETCDGYYTSNIKTFSPCHQKRKYVHVCPNELKESSGHVQKECQDQAILNNGKSFKGLSDSDLQSNGVVSDHDMSNKTNTDRTGSILVEHEINNRWLFSPASDDPAENTKKKSIDERKQCPDVPLKSSGSFIEKINSSIDSDFEKLNIYDDTPGIKRNIESPSAWKSPWLLINDGFPLGKRITASAAFEEFAYLLGSHGNDDNNSFDAIGLMRHLSEHNVVSLTGDHEILRGVNSTKSHSNDVSSRPVDSFTITNNHQLQNRDKENFIHSLPNSMMEGRVLDFSECRTPSKENKFEVENIHHIGPDSYKR